MNAIDHLPANPNPLTGLKRLEILFWDTLIQYLSRSRPLRQALCLGYRLTHGKTIEIFIFMVSVLLVFLLVILFIASGQIDRLMAAFSPAAAYDSKSVSTQENILIVHVSTTRSVNPDLLSVWGVFADWNSSPTLIFKPLYPRPTYDEISTSLVKSFTLTPQGKPSSSFVQMLEFDGIKWDKTIVVDQQDIMALSVQLASLGNKVQAITPAKPEILPPILREEIGIINGWCGSLSSSAGDINLSQHLIPERLLQGSESRNLLSNWDKLKAAPENPRCKIINPAN